MSIVGKIVVITGAGSGIGRALAVGFARDGAQVVGFERDADGLAETGRMAGANFDGFPGDVTSDTDVAALVDFAHARHGRIDVLVNNAGIARQGAFLSLPFDDWAAVVNVNLIGLARCTRAVLPGMIERGHGRVINVASRAAEAASPTLSAYAASKAGVVAFTRALSKEVGPPHQQDILVNCLIPGPTDTGMHAGGQNPASVYPHARFVAEFPPGGPHGRLFWNSQDYAIYTRFNDRVAAAGL